MTASTLDHHSAWRQSVEPAARRLAAITAAGAFSGLLVGGIGGRFVMFILARANPKATGVESDDGFVMGQFTTSGTANLLVLGTFLGVLGGGVYFVLRGLRIGPRWFEILSMSGAAGVVIGSMLIHTDGVDFHLLKPAYLPIAMFIAIPGIFVVLLTVLVEQWVAPGGWFMQTSRRKLLVLLLLWIPLAPVLLILVVGWTVGANLRQVPAVRDWLRRPLLPWTARLALTAFFVERFLALTSDVSALT